MHDGTLRVLEVFLIVLYYWYTVYNNCITYDI